MEFITPEEVADYVMLELQGRPTGKDIVAALDASTAGPTYRAGVLRRNAMGRLKALAEAAWRLLTTDAALRQQIISVELPIVAPDGKTVYRGNIVVVPPETGGGRDPLSAAPRGWVDLRPEQFGVGIKRAGAMLQEAEARQAGPQTSGSDVAWNAIEPDDPIEPSRFATWVFTVEDKGTRIKR